MLRRGARRRGGPVAGRPPPAIAHAREREGVGLAPGQVLGRAPRAWPRSTGTDTSRAASRCRLVHPPLLSTRAHLRPRRARAARDPLTGVLTIKEFHRLARAPRWRGLAATAVRLAARPLRSRPFQGDERQGGARRGLLVLPCPRSPRRSRTPCARTTPSDAWAATSSG